MVRAAMIQDWEKLCTFYKSAYRNNHPLLNYDFWIWQYGNNTEGIAYVVELNGEIKGHLGVIFSDNLSWVINLYIDQSIRASRWLMRLYDAVREHGYNLVTTNANHNALNLYRKMHWIRYSNLERYISINPLYANVAVNQLLQPVAPVYCSDKLLTDKYFRQPGLKGVLLSSGSTGVSQDEFGGFRFVEIKSHLDDLQEVWHLGYRWCDYLTSWNDNLIDKLLRQKWMSESEVQIPWKIYPMEAGSKSNVSLLSESPIPKDLIVTRKHSDHGRIASL